MTILQYAVTALIFLDPRVINFPTGSVTRFLCVYFSILYYSKQEKKRLLEAAEQLPDNWSTSSVSRCWSSKAPNPEVESENIPLLFWICILYMMQIFNSIFVVSWLLSSVTVWCYERPMYCSLFHYIWNVEKNMPLGAHKV